MRNVNLLIALGSAVFLASSVHAQTAGGSDSGSQPKAPLSQASESVAKNLARDPDNRGLQNAAQRIADNQARLAQKRAEQEERRAEGMERGIERGMDARDARANLERPVRLDRPGRGR